MIMMAKLSVSKAPKLRVVRLRSFVALNPVIFVKVVSLVNLFCCTMTVPRENEEFKPSAKTLSSCCLVLHHTTFSIEL